MDRKGIVLVITMIIVAILLLLTGVYFLGVITEKTSADSEKFVLQALNLAESGVNHASVELKKRTGTDLKTNVEASPRATTSNDLKNYFQNQNPLGLLGKYAQFDVADGKAIFSVTTLNLNTAVAGTYAATVTVEPDPDPDPDHTDPDLNPTNPSTDTYTFYYIYNIVSQAKVTKVRPNIQKTVSLLQGKFKVTVNRYNFAKFALFTSHHSTPSGTTVWFTEKTNFTGPVHTNGHFSFANNPSAHFTEEVTQHEQKADFYHSPRPLNADSYPPYDVPIFNIDKGFQRSYDEIVLPPAVTQEDLKKQAMATTSDNFPSGIHVPNDGTTVTGGIYIKGNQGTNSDDAIINMGNDINGPVYTITQGSTTKIITIDYTKNGGEGETKVQTGLNANTYIGVPDGVGNEGILIYANDDIKGFAGTVQKDSNVTVSSERDIVITNNIQYEINPQLPGNENSKNLLGILAWGGDVRIGTAAPNDIQINGVVMAPHGVFTVDNYNWGSPRGIASLLGGAITDFYGPFGTFNGNNQISGYGRNFVYDARMLQGMAPPYFPYMSSYTSSTIFIKKPIWQDEGR